MRVIPIVPASGGQLPDCGQEGFQTVINVGMNMALVPVTGLPLPFVSYGGNAMLALFLMVGLAQSVAMRKQKIDF